MDFSKVKNLAIPEGNVTSISIGGKVVWKKTEEPPAVNSFYIEDASGQPNTLSLEKYSSGAPKIKIEYSTDNRVWKEWVDCQTTTLPIAANSKVYLRGTNKVFYTGYYDYNTFNCTGKFNIGGDITTLLTPEGNILDLTGRNYVFSQLFKQSNVNDLSQLILPATTLADNCYQYMFYGCSKLTTAPELPATTLAYYCYSYMFYGCSKLTIAPKLPATTLASGCYSYMFNGCSKLTIAPELPATTLAEQCYKHMFFDCSSLTTAPELPAMELFNTCYAGMFKGCSKLTTAPKLPAMTLADGCYGYMGGNNISGMFEDCTSLTQAPELPATTLARSCYSNMFNGCTKLTVAPELPATTLKPYCYESMFYGCTKLITAPALPATTLARRCYTYMFQGCTSLTQAPNLPATTLADSCYYYMFFGCSKLTTAPELPATTLAQSCYESMFQYCREINYIKVGAISWNTSSTYNWLSGTAATGTIEMPAELVTWDGTGTQPEGSIPLNNVSGVPTGWTAKKPVARPNAFRFKNVSSLPNTLKLTKKTSTAPTVTLEKSSNGVDFVPFDCYSGIELQPGETVYLRGSNKTFATSVQNRNKFSSNNDIECYGSIMDLCDNGTDTIICTESYQFYGLFEDMSYLLTTPELPAITLTPHCYHALFFRCTSLASIPETLLPATTLIDDCYQTMFGQCTGLKTIPEKLLQSTELANNCYCGMFDGCTALTNSPQLPATTLAGSCYLGMFSGCTALVTAPELPATTLAYRSYESMFSKCHKINYIKIGATSWSRQVEGSIYYNASKWLEKAAAVGTIEMPAELQIGNGEGQIPENSVNGVPTGWTAKKPVVVNSFYIEDASGQPNTLSLTQTGAAPVKLEYSNDGIVWQEWVDCQTTTLPVAANSKVYLRGTNNVFSKAYDIYNKFNCTGKFNVGGDITSLLTPEGNVLDLTGRDNVFYYLFQNTNVIDASKLVLPATTLAVKCYSYMFQSCTSLTQAPKLPATTLASSCYSSMFYDCTSLTQAPELPAITLAKKCYYSMFWNCTSLTSAPELPAKYLYDYCYSYMFYGCRKLITASRILPANTTSSYCYQDMFDGCTSLVTAPELPATTLAPYCYSNMFYGCTSLTTAPKELPATTLAQRCYEYMFNSCTSLETAPDILSNSINGMYSLEGMFNGCSKLNYVKVGATTWNTSNTGSWLSGVSATGTFVKPTATNIPTGVNGIPSGWTVENV